MGDQHVRAVPDAESLHRFSRALLDDLAALETLRDDGRLERGVTRIGLEQELFLIDAAGRPAHVGPAVLETLRDPAFSTEIGCFNLELGVEPLLLGDGALTALETTLRESLARARAAARLHGADVLLAGILPSVALADLTRDALTPTPRYHALDERIVALAGGSMRTSIQGDDDLQLELDTVVLEACNTSVQVHLQVDPDRLVTVYNVAQLAAAPVLAAAVNSPLLLQRRLWHETRIPTFEQSVDARSGPDRARGSWQRVHFGDDWVHGDILDLYRDQVARHQVVLVGEPTESSRDVLARREVPRLRALALHNGTLYRWNRLCYGVTDGVPHLRIEHRPLPSGPTIRDEVANVAFWLGLVLGLEHELGDPATQLRFADVRASFHAAAHHGLAAELRWLHGETVPARRLIGDTLLPIAERGLRRAGVRDDEATRALDVIAARVALGVSGASWTRAAWDALAPIRNPVARAQALTRAIRERQWHVEPVTAWEPIGPHDLDDWPHHVARVQEVMSTDLFTVRADDLVDVAASVMAWKHVRHVPVQDEHGALAGLVSHRQLLAARDESDHARRAGDAPRAVRDIMARDVVTIAPDASCAEAVARMRAHRVGCLPVLHQGRLIGIVSERDFLPFAEQWFARDDAISPRPAAPAADGGSAP
jgi:CBS domain-containing protein